MFTLPLGILLYSLQMWKRIYYGSLISLYSLVLSTVSILPCLYYQLVHFQTVRLTFLVCKSKMWQSIFAIIRSKHKFSNVVNSQGKTCFFAKGRVGWKGGILLPLKKSREMLVRAVSSEVKKKAG